MTTKYFTGRYGTSINPIEVVRETGKSVYIKEPIGARVFREAKSCTYGTYHDTWQDAYAHILMRCKTRAKTAKEHHIMAEHDLREAKALREHS